MKKHLIVPALILGISLTATACSSEAETSTQGSGTHESAPSSAVPTSSLVQSTPDAPQTVKGEVGKLHGLDCNGPNDCSVQFTVTSLERLDACDDFTSPMDTQPAGTHLVKATVRLETKAPTSPGFEPGEFPVWTEWSAATDGVTQQLPASNWCLNQNSEPWMRPIRTGDTVIKVHYMDVPDGATAINLTEQTTQGRWTFDAP